jgi:hypothetical protein
MTKKIAKKKVTKNDEVKTLSILPDKGVLGVIADVASVGVLITALISLTILCLTMAEKITITVGK